VPWGTLSDLEIKRRRGEAAVGGKKQGKTEKIKPRRNNYVTRREDKM
jgi:hypothetical protein